MGDFDKVQDSGKRQNFNTGSVRDTDNGKGNPHLIAGEVFVKVNEYYERNGLCYESCFVNSKTDLINKIKNLLWEYTKLVDNKEKEC